MTRLPTPDVLGDVLGAAPAIATMIDVDRVRIDGGTQMRAGLDEETVGRYVTVLQDAGDTWPFPVVTVFYDGQAHWMADGFHRHAAARRVGRVAIPADIRAGTQRDAVLFAAGANAAHGLPRSQADKRRSVRCLLTDPEWCGWSDREIARRCNVSADLVGQVRRELYPPAPVTVDSDSEPAPAPQHRTYTTKAGTVAVMDTSRIGQRPEPAYIAVRAIEQYVESAIKDLYPQDQSFGERAAMASDMRRQAKAGAGDLLSTCASLLDADGKEFRKRDLVQAINNVAARIERPPVYGPMQPPVSPPVPLPAGLPSYPDKLLVDYTEDDWAAAAAVDVQRRMTKAQRAVALVPTVLDFARNYRDAHNRTARELGPDVAAHSNSTFWRDITAEFRSRGMPTDEDVWKDAIKQAVTQLQNVPEPQPAALPPVSQRDDYDSDEWYTPEEIIRTAAHVMGSIDLDPASCELAQTVVQAATYYTKQDDGLTSDWHGSVWLNPPYSQPQAWVDKLFSEMKAGRVTQAIVLVNNATETAWFQRLLGDAKLACFPSRRLAFWRHDHSNVGARQGQCLFYFGSNADKFYASFSATGVVLRRLK